ncbi:hypothetical protein FB566_0297 [Stackebrandtia endophytica]|uniref:HTH merR-type domain-containing protein n=1 Tax=Stackebrandtia endophytica TaxID=1496996 RepID=A0A543AQH1_9ACTN|nr:MerR family transcriptional regulator [Stackebrandtia endophytica]TQL74809.1 hypothetical protein FB566_0297 [Stackebrandtia endophytica]
MTEDNARWPIGELADRVALALSDAVTGGYPGPADARVRGVPDIRSIRWYTTIGLLDKPGGYRGRTALYGPRHLRQLVSVKRRQARGVPLASVQAEMVGLTDAELSDIAGIPPDSPALAESVPSTGAPATGRSDPLKSADRHASQLGAEHRADSADSAPPMDTRFWSRTATTVTVADHAHPPESSLSYGVRLAPGVTVLIAADQPPDAEDLAAIQEAATPLLRTLRVRGLNRTGVDR